jgi:hypothetical protein
MLRWVAFGGVLLCLGCDRAQPAVGPSTSETHRDRRNHKSDGEIFDLVFTDLITNTNFANAVVSDPTFEKQQVVVDSASRRIVNQRGLESLYWNTRKTIPDDVQRDYVERNPIGPRQQLDWYSPADARIIVCDLSRFQLDEGEFMREYPSARGYVKPSLPGYSQSGTTAVLVFFFGPNGPHGDGIGVYQAELSDGRWKIASRFLGQIN